MSYDLAVGYLAVSDFFSPFSGLDTLYHPSASVAKKFQFFPKINV